MGQFDIGTIPANLPPKEDIVGMIVQDMEVGLKVSTTIYCSMLDKVLMELGEVDLDLGTYLIPPIIKVIMIDQLIFIFMGITEVEIGCTPGNFLHITMVD